MDKKALKSFVPKTPKKLGRITVITDEVTAKICEALKRGSSIEAACINGGIHKATFYRKLQKDPTFATKIGFAISYMSTAAYEVLHDEIVFNKNLKAAMWWLERSVPERYSKRVVTLQIKKTVKLAISAKKTLKT